MPTSNVTQVRYKMMLNMTSEIENLGNAKQSLSIVIIIDYIYLLVAMYNLACFLTLFPSQFLFMVDKTLLSEAGTFLWKCFCHNMCPVHRTHNGAVGWAKDCKVQSGQQLNYTNTFFFHFQFTIYQLLLPHECPIIIDNWRWFWILLPQLLLKWLPFNINKLGTQSFFFFFSVLTT